MARRVKREQPRKDNRSKRVNYDNERQSKFDKQIKDISCTDKSNDVSWYAHNGELLRAAASLPFSQTTGANLGFRGSLGTDGNVPGIMALAFEPCIGGWNDSAINSAKESTYSFTVHANSRNTSYTASDQMMVILAGAQVFAAIAAGIRAYGTMKLFDQRNKYLPKYLVSAMGFNYDNLQQNLSQMWFDLNDLVARASQIWIPNDFPFVDRWFWLNSNIYMDSESIKGQYYIMAQASYLMYDEKQTSSGGGLSWIKPDGNPLPANGNLNDILSFHPGSNYSWHQYMVMVTSMIGALLDSEDRGIIMGDMLKAYGAERIYALSPIPVDYTVKPVYDKEVLTQIENAVVWRDRYFSIQQENVNNTIYTNWGVWTGSTALPVTTVPTSQSVLNFHQMDTPTPEQVMVATRLKVAGCHKIISGGKLVKLVPNTMGTEYVVQINVVQLLVDGSSQFTEIEQATTQTTINFGIFYRHAAFDWCPWIYLVSGTAPTPGMNPSDYVAPEVRLAAGDWDNYTIIDDVTLRKQHTTAVYSEFNVPTLS